MHITIVETETELQECLAIRHRVFVEEQGVPVDLENDKNDASPRACVHVLVSVDGTPAGTGRWIAYAPDTAKIQRLAVLPEYRGQGVGAKVLGALEQQARSAGMNTCILDSQCHAESFYKRLGYETISKQPFEDAGIMHVRMRKTLSGA